MVPKICGALQVCRQLKKVFNLPAHMTQFTISADLESNIAQIEATFLFDETMLKENDDARERTTAEKQPVDAQGEANVATSATDSGQSCKPAEQKDGFKFWL